ncbi:thiamine-phosphate pyrophosphorylase [Helicobacter sp. MIT 14-3879]|uniref:thiamine-phosphate pyrophosphorylase n=1 Tax=Helicobacter sp. MIT 14-3879 TaxID=2040649 RepID=UPI0015F132C2|nr:thiamine-phosphate pyrophosphorylase [Helicobacter sp. MIT 14-3879]
MRILDANLNRIREGIRVIEDIARYILENKELSIRLKNIRHLCRIDKDFIELIRNRDIKKDILKQSTISEQNRDNIKSIAIANFKRSQESARVLEEMLKIESNTLSEQFKKIRYELYDIEITYFAVLEKYSIL